MTVFLSLAGFRETRVFGHCKMGSLHIFSISNPLSADIAASPCLSEHVSPIHTAMPSALSRLRAAGAGKADFPVSPPVGGRDNQHQRIPHPKRSIVRGRQVLYCTSAVIRSSCQLCYRPVVLD